MLLFDFSDWTLLWKKQRSKPRRAVFPARGTGIAAQSANIHVSLSAEQLQTQIDYEWTVKQNQYILKTYAIYGQSACTELRG